MIGSIINFVKLPFLLLVIWAALRFSLGVFFGVPYTPRGNAMFSMVGLTLICSIIYGALSTRSGFSWMGTLMVGVFIALFAQVLIFLLSVISLGAGLTDSYFIHWDSLNIAEGETMGMGALIQLRFVGILVNAVIGGLAAGLGRLLSGLAPSSAAQA